MAGLGLRLPGGSGAARRSVSYLYTARLVSLQLGLGSMGAVGTGVLAAAEGVEVDSLGLRGAW